MSPLKAALVQQRHTADAVSNRRRSAEAIRQAHAGGAELVVLSELHGTRYFCQTEAPEAARLMALAGADLLIYPTAIGWDPADAESEKQRQLDAWVTIQRSHAVANGLPVLSVNRVGYEPAPQGEGGIQFWGHSFAVGAQGEFLAQASPEAEDGGR